MEYILYCYKPYNFPLRGIKIPAIWLPDNLLNEFLFI